MRNGVWLAVVLLAACHDSAQSPDGGDPTKAACGAGTPTRTAEGILAGLQGPFAITVDNAHLYVSESTGSGKISRVDKDGGNATLLIDEGLSFADDLAVDDQYLYYRTPTIKRIDKTTPGAATVLAAGFDDLHSHGMLADGAHVFFGGRDAAHGNLDVVMRVDRDGGNLTMLASADFNLHLVGLDAADVYYSVDRLSGATQMAVARDGSGAPRTLATGEACFDGGLDATYLYCSGVTHPFKVRLAGGDQIPLCQADLTASSNTLGNLAILHNTIYLLSLPHSGVSMPANSGTLVGVSIFGGGHALAGGIDDPRMIVSDGSALYWTENRLGVIMKVTP